MFLFACIIGSIVLFCVFAYKRKQEIFVSESSAALRSLREVNSRYSFISIPSFDMTQCYDNKSYYDTISPSDYLVYQLIYKQNAVKNAIADAAVNSSKKKLYESEIESLCVFGKLDNSSVNNSPSKIDRILREYWLSKGFDDILLVEQSLFQKEKRNPVTEVKITVAIHLTNVQGRWRNSKSATFCASDILEQIAKLQQKTNGFYADPSLWQAICRVERGKVTNRMRFAIYNRDGNRCRNCGSTRDLEIDHIYPISKGGKTTFDNLQTLCRECNIQKSNRIMPNAAAPRNVQNHSVRMCPNCRISLVKRHGSYGEFWGCPNYPWCKYTSK